MVLWTGTTKAPVSPWELCLRLHAELHEDCQFTVVDWYYDGPFCVMVSWCKGHRLETAEELGDSGNGTR